MSLYVVKYRSDLYVTVREDKFLLTGDMSDCAALLQPLSQYELRLIADDINRSVEDLEVIEWDIEESVYVDGELS